jgi:hypothetical protein
MTALALLSGHGRITNVMFARRCVAAWQQALRKTLRYPRSAKISLAIGACRREVLDVAVVWSSTMARNALFESAPAVRFLKTLMLVGLLPAPQQAIAADISGAIASLAGRDFNHLQRCARALQDERWRLISSGISTIADEAFARVTILEQWLRARLEVLRPASPISEILWPSESAVLSMNSLATIPLFRPAK